MDRAQNPFYCSSHETVQVSINLQSKPRKKRECQQTNTQTNKWTDWSVRDCHTHTNIHPVIREAFKHNT